MFRCAANMRMCAIMDSTLPVTMHQQFNYFFGRPLERTVSGFWPPSGLALTHCLPVCCGENCMPAPLSLSTAKQLRCVQSLPKPILNIMRFACWWWWWWWAAIPVDDIFIRIVAHETREERDAAACCCSAVARIIAFLLVKPLCVMSSQLHSQNHFIIFCKCIVIQKRESFFSTLIYTFRLGNVACMWHALCPLDALQRSSRAMRYNAAHIHTYNFRCAYAVYALWKGILCAGEWTAALAAC